MYFRGCLVHFSMYVAGTTGSVLIREVLTLNSEVLNRGSAIMRYSMHTCTVVPGQQIQPKNMTAAIYMYLTGQHRQSLHSAIVQSLHSTYSSTCSSQQNETWHAVQCSVNRKITNKFLVGVIPQLISTFPSCTSVPFLQHSCTH